MTIVYFGIMHISVHTSCDNTFYTVIISFNITLTCSNTAMFLTTFLAATMPKTSHAWLV